VARDAEHLPAASAGAAAGRAGGAPAMPAGRQLGLLWGGVATLLVLAAPRAERIAAALPDCPFRGLTGMPCPACGSGGAASALAQLDVAGAFAASPLAALGWIALIAGGLVAGLAALGGRVLPEGPARIGAWPRAVIVLAVLANWSYVIATR
jgi:hypothetical protein